MIYKAMFDAISSTWQAYGRAVFVETDAPEEERRALAVAAAEKDYPGSRIVFISMGESTEAARKAFLDRKARERAWNQRNKDGIANRPEYLTQEGGEHINTKQGKAEAMSDMKPDATLLQRALSELQIIRQMGIFATEGQRDRLDVLLPELEAVAVDGKLLSGMLQSKPDRLQLLTAMAVREMLWRNYGCSGLSDQLGAEIQKAEAADHDEPPYEAVIRWFELEYGYNPDPSRTPNSEVLRWAQELRVKARAEGGG